MYACNGVVNSKYTSIRHFICLSMFEIEIFPCIDALIWCIDGDGFGCALPRRKLQLAWKCLCKRKRYERNSFVDCLMLYCSSFVVECFVPCSSWVDSKNKTLMYGCHCMNIEQTHCISCGMAQITKVEQTFCNVTFMQIYEAIAIIYIFSQCILTVVLSAYNV